MLITSSGTMLGRLSKLTLTLLEIRSRQALRRSSFRMWASFGSQRWHSLLLPGVGSLIRDSDGPNTVSDLEQRRHPAQIKHGVQKMAQRWASSVSYVGDDATLFEKLFDILQEDLTSHGLTDEETSDAFKWFRRVNSYNVPHGKKYRGLSVLQSFRFLAKNREISADDLKRAAVVGWCLEWFAAAFLIADDIMDSSLTRRGQPCWYKVDGVGLQAVNDSVYLESAIYVLLKKYLRDRPYYMDVVELFQETTLQTITGQTLEIITSSTNRTDCTSYTIERYKTIIKYKAGHICGYVPVACAMFMAGIKDQESHEEAKQILLKLGELFQIQNDFFDCYGDPATTGKIGNDIEENRCSWLIVKALQAANKEQRVALKENYGRYEPECVNRVKDVYEELKLKEIYANYEETSYSELMKDINEMNAPLPKEMFKEYVRKIYKRKK